MMICYGMMRATIDLQNIPLSRGGALLGVTFQMPNDGFLYYDPEEAPHPKAPLQDAVRIQSAQHGSRFHQGTLCWYTLPHSLLAKGALKELQVSHLNKNNRMIPEVYFCALFLSPPLLSSSYFGILGISLFLCKKCLLILSLSFIPAFIPVWLPYLLFLCYWLLVV